MLTIQIFRYDFESIDQPLTIYDILLGNDAWIDRVFHKPQVFMSKRKLKDKQKTINDIISKKNSRTYSLQSLDIWIGTLNLQSMIIVRVSLSLASWNGASPHTNMYRITPRLHTSEMKEL